MSKEQNKCNCQYEEGHSFECPLYKPEPNPLEETKLPEEKCDCPYIAGDHEKGIPGCHLSPQKEEPEEKCPSCHIALVEIPPTHKHYYEAKCPKCDFTETLKEECIKCGWYRKNIHDRSNCKCEEPKEEILNKILGHYNGEILNKFQDIYLMEKGPGCEEILFPVLEKALKDFINPPNDGMIRRFDVKQFLSQEISKAKQEVISLCLEKIGNLRKEEIIIQDCEECGEEGYGKAWFGKGKPNDPYGYGDAYHPTGSVVFCKECSPKFRIGQKWDGEEIWKTTSDNPKYDEIRINHIKKLIPGRKGANEVLQILSDEIKGINLTKDKE